MIKPISEFTRAYRSGISPPRVFKSCNDCRIIDRKYQKNSMMRKREKKGKSAAQQSCAVYIRFRC